MGTVLFPYPKRDHAENPPREGFPVRPRRGQEPTNAAEEAGAIALRHMNEVIARIQELEEALEDPANVWSRLREAWRAAEDEAKPRMAEIVRQSRRMQPVLQDLIKRIRRVLRRHRELTPLDRVQEMDRASMVWLSRQPGRSIAERAGSAQRILATVRRENFDTLENRVLFAYAKLASELAREWLREHPRATRSDRYISVDAFRKATRSLVKLLSDLGVTEAQAGITPNYVLMQDRSYHEVHENWIRLLERQKAEDDLWAWQAETWTDFAVVAIILAIDELEEAELVAQSPVDWHYEAVGGKWFSQDRPIAVFWLRETNRVVEIMSRPEAPGTLLTVARAHVALRITDPSRSDPPRRVAVWTPHAMLRLDLEEAATEAASLLQQLQPLATSEIMRDGLIMTPAWGRAEAVEEKRGNVRLKAIALGPSGDELSRGFSEVRAFVRSEIYKGAA
ncbi:hypothetical protein [Maritimibacter dapengensis]|nr:hypothetical protein [Maritimibacter dapengensis]